MAKGERCPKCGSGYPVVQSGACGKCGPNAPRYRADCTCPCHKNPGVMHIVPCCEPEPVAQWWKLVPYEPTTVQHSAGNMVQVDTDQTDARVIYRAMLAAAPTPPIPMIAEAGERERARMAAFTAIAGENPDPFLMPESYEHACAVADAVLAALPTSATLDNTAVPVVHPFAEWRADHGDVLWWRIPIVEAPYVGSPLDVGRSMKVEVAVGFERHEFPVVDTGGWPFSEDDQPNLFWSALPDARAINAAAVALLTS